MRFEKIGRHTAKETSDRKPVGLPLRLKELRTFACFPFTSFRILAFLQKCYSQNPPADWLCKSAPLTSNLSFMHSPCSFPQALLSALQALSSIIASPPLSPVRILMAVSSSDTKIFPSPTCPVLQVSRIVSISFSNGVS